MDLGEMDRAPRWNTKFISHSKCVIEWHASFGQSIVWYFKYKRETVALVFTCGYAGIVIVGFHVLLLLLLRKWSKVAKTGPND